MSLLRDEPSEHGREPLKQAWTSTNSYERPVGRRLGERVPMGRTREYLGNRTTGQHWQDQPLHPIRDTKQPPV